MTAGTVAGLKPYPAYRPSGVEWLGEVPAHWEVRRLKYVVTLVMGQSPPGETCSDKPIGLPFLQGCAEFGERYPSPHPIVVFEPEDGPVDGPSDRGTRLPRGLSGDMMASLP